MMHSSLGGLFKTERNYRFETIYVNDGSTDGTLSLLHELAAQDKRIKVVSFSRNFGKEQATTAGIQLATGDAIITLDADGQHPVNLIPDLLAAWQAGSQVVIGVRRNAYPSRFKNLTSRFFYSLFNQQSEAYLTPAATDYRLIDKAVQQEFLRLPEHSRMTRALIDWLGFERTFVPFDMAERYSGKASYSTSKLLQLALNSFVSLSLRPLYAMAYAGAAALLLSIVLAIFSVTEMAIGDPMHLRITGTAYLVMFVLFLVGIMLIAQGVTALYISHIHLETKGRPLYIIDKKASRGLQD